MVYKVSSTDRIKDDRKVTFNNITATVERREFGTQTLSNGYVAGGRGPSNPDPNNDINAIDKFSFASDGNAAATGGTLSVTTSFAFGHSSGSHGFTAGGTIPSISASAADKEIFKYPFAISSGTSTLIGDLARNRRDGEGINGGGDGFVAGGFGSGDATHPPIGGAPREFIDKFSFSSDGNATNVGDLNEGKAGSASANSQTHGYISGGLGVPTTPGDVRKRITKFPFAISAGTSTAVGNLTGNAAQTSGQSSSTHGYRAGGADPSPGAAVNIIDKFPFSTDTNATDVGDLTYARQYLTGHSSTTHGYASGGIPGFYNVIDKFPFSSDTNASDVGDLVSGRYGAAGSQG